MPLAVPAADAVRRLGAFCPGTASGPLHLAFALHDRAAGPAPPGHPPAARLASARSLAEQAIWQQAGPGEHEASWVMGFAGRFWRPTRPLAQPDWPGFVAWRQPGTARVAWAFAVRLGPTGQAQLGLTLVAGGVDRRGHAALSAWLMAVGWLSRRLRGALCRAAARHCQKP